MRSTGGSPAADAADAPLRCGHCRGQTLVVRAVAAPLADLKLPAHGPRDERHGACATVDQWPVSWTPPRPCSVVPAPDTRDPLLRFGLVACATCRAVLGVVPLPATSGSDHA